MTVAERAKELETKLLHLYGFRVTQSNVCWVAEALGEIEDAIRDAMLACAEECERWARRNENCPPGCKCADGYHCAVAIRLVATASEREETAPVVSPWPQSGTSIPVTLGEQYVRPVFCIEEN